MSYRPIEVRKLPVVTEAFEFNGTYQNAVEITEWAEDPETHRGNVYLGHYDIENDTCTYLDIDTREGVMTASPGDWIVRGVENEYWAVKPSIFAKTYEKT